MLTSNEIKEIGRGMEALRIMSAEYTRLASLQSRISTWGKETFGKGQHIDGVYAHLVREIEELGDKLDTLGAAEEIADCAILLFELADFHNVDMLTEVEGKLAINRTREWGPIQEDGSILHIRKDQRDDYKTGGNNG